MKYKPIYGILYSNRFNGLMLLNMTLQQKVQALTRLNLCGVSSGFALFGTLCLNGLDAHAVTANVANADISANNAGPDQMPHV